MGGGGLANAKTTYVGDMGGFGNHTYDTSKRSNQYWNDFNTKKP